MTEKKVVIYLDEEEWIAFPLSDLFDNTHTVLDRQLGTKMKELLQHRVEMNGPIKEGRDYIIFPEVEVYIEDS